VVADSASVTVQASAGEATGNASATALPGWLAILPALVAIALALALRQVIPALFLGIWIGAALVYGFSVGAIWYGLLDTLTTYTLKALNDSGHLSIILFSLMIGGMVGIISKNGGTSGIVNSIVGWARSPRRGQTTTGILGVAIFFDDYAKTLIVGNTMRPITDRLKVSREKLAYIVDSTAAPVATLALVTTWIGFQVGLIDSAVQQIDGLNESAYSIFLNSLAYNYYPILAILFVFMVALLGRDFGPMLTAERRARSTGQVYRPDAHTGESAAEAAEREPKPDKPQLARNAVIPVLVLVFGSLAGIYITGAQGVSDDAALREIIGNGDSYQAMMWASLLAVLVAGLLSLGQGILTLGETIDAWYAGVRSMLLAVIILVLAWALSNVNEVLHTADFLVSTLGESLDPALMPAIIFVMSALTAFATGSSWGVMGVVMPLAIPLSWAVLAANGMTGDAGMAIFYATVASVLAGAVWGDHCSPISDTTILSSLASECDHIDHVRTQIPYALLVGIVGIGVGSLPVAYEYYSWWQGLLASIAILLVVLFVIGRQADKSAATATEPASAAAD
ncbi:MAG: Na+/H+ antiporter NhaC family protein, partial [Candidatus Competibacterales bacterium]|nr:Na+/H+ antiporter NhaC family protein [Candidatus Competibacterales bacterium]